MTLDSWKASAQSRTCWSLSASLILFCGLCDIGEYQKKNSQEISFYKFSMLFSFVIKDFLINRWCFSDPTLKFSVRYSNNYSSIHLSCCHHIHSVASGINLNSQLTWYMKCLLLLVWCWFGWLLSIFCSCCCFGLFEWILIAVVIFFLCISVFCVCLSRCNV